MGKECSKIPFCNEAMFEMTLDHMSLNLRQSDSELVPKGQKQRRQIFNIEETSSKNLGLHNRNKQKDPLQNPQYPQLSPEIPTPEVPKLQDKTLEVSNIASIHNQNASPGPHFEKNPAGNLENSKEKSVNKKFQYKDGSEYCGNMIKNLRHGEGKQVWKDGSTYEGKWMNDKANGFGTLTDKRGNKMAGSWRDNKLNGFAVKEMVNGDKYEGFWIDDMKNGEGVQTWASGARYEGHFLNNKLSGEGRFEWPDGSYYEGNRSIQLQFSVFSSDFSALLTLFGSLF